MRPASTDYAPMAATYVNLVPEDNIREFFPATLTSVEQFLDGIPESKADYSYAPGKWTVKQVLQHVIDTERVFSYRALAIARGEQQALPGFDQDSYAGNVDVSHRVLDSLKEELSLVRVSTILLFESISDEALLNRGIASNHEVTPLALAYMIIGHWRHHEMLFVERYGLQTAASNGYLS